MKKISLLILIFAGMAYSAYGGDSTSLSYSLSNSTANSNSNSNALGISNATGGSVGNLSSSSVSAGGLGGQGGSSTSNANGGAGGYSYATGGQSTSTSNGGVSTSSTGSSTANTGPSSSINGGNTMVLQSGDTIVPQGLISTMAQTDNPHLYSIQGGIAQASNLTFLLAQPWSPDHRDSVDGKSCRTTIVCVTDSRIEQYKGAGQNNFIFLDEKARVPDGLGSITISPRQNKGDEVDGSTLKSDIKTYVCNRYHGLNIYIKASWAASMYGVHSKGIAAQAVSSGSFFPGNVVSGIAGALGGNRGNTEALPMVSLTVILSDK